jgi:hypothetical protein
LLYRYAALRDDLNVSRAYRVCVAVSFAAGLAAIGAIWQPWLLVLAVCGLVALLWVDRQYYAFFLRCRGLLFTARWYPLHVLHHLTNGISFTLGSALYWIRRVTGIRVPGALPLDCWNSRPE